MDFNGLYMFLYMYALCARVYVVFVVFHNMLERPTWAQVGSGGPTLSWWLLFMQYFCWKDTLLFG